MISDRRWILIALLPMAVLAAEPKLDNAVCISVEKPTDKPGARCNIFLGKESPDIAEAYAIRPGDALEYDLLLSPTIPSVAGGLDIQFFGAKGLFGLLGEKAPNLLSQNVAAMKSAVGRWQQVKVPLDVAVGEKIDRLLLHVEGEKPGLYQIVLDNIRVTNGGATKLPFYTDEPTFNITILEASEFHSPWMLVFDRSKIAETKDLAALMGRLHKESVATRRMQAVARGLSLMLDENKRLGKPPELARIEETRKSYEAVVKLKDAQSVEIEPELDKFLAGAEWLRPHAKRFSIHAVSYAHLDFIWLWPWGETIQVATNDFRQMLKFMDEFPEFTFSYTSPSLFEAVEMENPALFAEVQKRIREGRWEMAGPRWCESDHNLISEESHARHFLYAHRYNKTKFGTETTVCFEPDIFGHLPTLPQMLRKSGLQYYIGGRTSVKPPVFWWEGIEGTRILSLGPRHYSEVLNESVLDFTLTRKERDLGYTDGLVIYGVGNHGGGPSRDQIVAATTMDKLPVFPTVKYGTLQGYMDTIARQPFVTNVPVIRGELRQNWRGTYTTHAETKRLNRACENTLAAAEGWAVFAQLLGLGPAANRFDVAWRSLLWAHHHDTIGGSTIHSSDLFVQHVLTNILRDVSADLQQTLGRFAAKVKTTGVTEVPRIVFNSVSWPVTAPVQLTLPDARTAWEWTDINGQTAPVNAAGFLVLRDLPAFGYRTGWLRPVTRKDNSGVEKMGKFGFRNRQLQIEVSPQSGNLVRLTHLASKAEWIGPGTEGARLRVDFEKPHDMSAWEIGPIEKSEWLDQPESVECVEEGRVRAVIRARYKFGKSVIEKDIILYRDLSRVDFDVRVDWNERGTADTLAPMLRIVFPTSLASSQAEWLIPFGEIQRPQDGDDYAASYGMGLTGDGRSICLLSNSKNGFNATNNTIGVTLLRSPYYPDPAPDVGTHRIPLALEVSDRDWAGAAFARRGMEFNRRPVVVDATPHNGKLPAEMSFLSVEPATVLLTALKTSYDTSTNLVARVYQSANTPTKVKVTSPLTNFQWVESDLIERIPTNAPVADPASLPLGRWEIKTYRLR